MGATGGTPEETLLKMRHGAVAEAKKLVEGLMDIIVFACTSGSFIGGAGYDEDIIKELEAAASLPSTTTSTCVLTAFADLGVKKIVLVGPYPKEVFNVEVQFFKDHGIDTLYVEALGYTTQREFALLQKQPYIFYHLAKEAYKAAPDVDAIFITCMAAPAIKIIDTLEQETGKPVISSCSATLYGVLKKLGIKEPIEGYGQLLRKLGEK